MDHHPIHLHGYTFKVVATDGGAIPAAGQWPETTVLVPVGSTRDVEFVADAPGDWAMHCHMTHHVMNQMGHDTPSFVGADTTALDRAMAKLVPTYMTMGRGDGRAWRAWHADVPKNSVPMRGCAWAVRLHRHGRHVHGAEGAGRRVRPGERVPSTAS
jgi:hypothetical protein